LLINYKSQRGNPVDPFIFKKTRIEIINILIKYTNNFDITYKIRPFFIIKKQFEIPRSKFYFDKKLGTS